MTHFLGRVSKVVAVLAIVALCASYADAQGGGGQRGQRGNRGGGLGGGASYVSVAANADVQALLKATDAQKTTITEANTKLNEDRQALFTGGGDRGSMAGDIAKLNADAGAKVAAALDATQNANLLSVLVQAAGGRALLDAQVQKALKITDAQKTQLTAVMPPRGAGRGATPEEQAQARAETDKLYTDVLTADQKTEWAKMEKAQKVDDELLATLRRGGGFGGNRGRRGGGGAGGGN